MLCFVYHLVITVKLMKNKTQYKWFLINEMGYLNLFQGNFHFKHNIHS